MLAATAKQAVVLRGSAMRGPQLLPGGARPRTLVVRRFKVWGAPPALAHARAFMACARSRAAMRALHARAHHRLLMTRA